MVNHWIKTRSKREQLKVGDWVYWKREIFTDTEWTTILLQYGVEPMRVVQFYYDTNFRQVRLEVIDCNGNSIIGVRADRLRKVDKDFEARL